jgi:hypothetical protein
MPALPIDATQRSNPSDVRSSQSIQSGLRPLIPSSSQPADDRILQLQKNIDELKSLLLSQTTPYVHVRSQQEGKGLFTPPSTSEEQILNDSVEIDEGVDHVTSKSSFHTNGVIPSTTNNQTFAPQPPYFRPEQTAGREVSVPRTAQIASLPSMNLRNCKSGSCYLPLPSEGSSLLNDYLHDFNNRMPLFHPDAICSHIRDCYSGTADHLPLKWVVAYVALGIGHRLRAMSLFAAADDTSNAEFYLNRCLALLPDLLIQEPSLLLIQGLLGVAVLLQTSHRTRKAALFVSTAMRLAQGLAYNEVGQDQDQRVFKDKQEFNVFWIAFTLETTMNIRAMRPNTQALADISLPLPGTNPPDALLSGTSDPSTSGQEINVFALFVSLAVIQAEALEELFSARARQRPAALITSSFKSIISKLELWRKSNPLAIVDVTRMLKSMYRSDMVHSVILEATYFEFLYQLHAAERLGAFHRRLDVFSPDGLRSAAGLVSFNIYADAQRLLEFAAVTSQGNVSVTW